MFLKKIFFLKKLQMNNIFKNLIIVNSKQKKRISKNFISGLSTESFQLLSQLFFAPLMLFFWGANNFGIWLFILSIPNVLLVFNINFQASAVQEITIFNLKRKYHKSNIIFQNSILLNLINISIISLLAIIFFFFDFIKLPVFEALSRENVKFILILIFISIYLDLFNSVFTTAIYSIGKLYIKFYTSTIIDLCSKISIAFSGFYFDSLLYPAIIYLLFTILKFMILFFFYSKLNKHLIISFNLVSKKEILRMFKLSLGYSADIINFLIKHSLIIFLMGLFLDPYIIGYVVTLKTLFYFLPIRFFGKIYHISLFEFAELFSKKKFLLIKKNIFKLNILSFSLLLIYMILALTLGPFFYNLWTNYKYELSFTLLLLIVFDAFLFIMRNSIITFFKSINRYFIFGTSDLILTVISTYVFYIMLLNQISLNYAFFIIVLTSFISLIFSLIYFFYCFKNLKVNK